MITDEEIRDQFKSTECLDEFVDNRRKLEGNIDAIVKNRRSKQCKNQTSLDGWDIKEYAPDGIFTLHDRNAKREWCFRYTDIPNLLNHKTNPYSGLAFTDAQLKMLEEHAPQNSSPYPALPLSIQLKDLDIKGRCPLWRGNSDTVLYKYICENESIDNEEILSRPRRAETMAAKPCIGTLYRVILNTPYTSGMYLPDHPEFVERVEIVTRGDVVESSPRPEKTYLSPSDYANLKYFMSSDGVDLKDYTTLYQENLRPTHTLTLYRGLSFKRSNNSARKFLEMLERENLSVGDKISYVGKKNAESWTTNVCLATAFAMTGEDGIVLKYRAAPEEIIVDTRMIENLKDFYHADQAEVVLSASKKPYTREVEIYFITKDYSSSYWQRTLTKPDLNNVE